MSIMLVKIDETRSPSETRKQPRDTFIQPGCRYQFKGLGPKTRTIPREYECVGLKSHLTLDGEVIDLAVLKGLCVDCGAAFQCHILRDRHPGVAPKCRCESCRAPPPENPAYEFTEVTPEIAGHV
jgi:hypothetical protein